MRHYKYSRVISGSVEGEGVIQYLICTIMAL